ncbi:MAG: hypothetical protein GTO04_06485 [Planctomycetales bacterium]|nr:hypothetical protein [Planctomycetales bacterium]
MALVRGRSIGPEEAIGLPPDRVATRQGGYEKGWREKGGCGKEGKQRGGAKRRVHNVDDRQQLQPIAAEYEPASQPKNLRRQRPEAGCPRRYDAAVVERARDKEDSRPVAGTRRLPPAVDLAHQNGG